jgi:lipoate-protein ligase A
MALDEALLERARETGEAVIRIYGWVRPVLSLGRNQTARGRYDLERARVLGVSILRRPTGGRAVLHHREVTYSVTAPEGSLGSLRESYQRINRLLLTGLRRLGIAAREAEPAGVAPRPGVLPCFEAPVAGEIVARVGEGGAERKLVGSAQVRENGALLQHGSILVDDDQMLASTLLAHPVPPPPPPATLRELLGREPAPAEVAQAIFAELEGAEPLEIDPALQAAARALSARYEDPAWTWRR